MCCACKSESDVKPQVFKYADISVKRLGKRGDPVVQDLPVFVLLPCEVGYLDRMRPGRTVLGNDNAGNDAFQFNLDIVLDDVNGARIADT